MVGKQAMLQMIEPRVSMKDIPKVREKLNCKVYSITCNVFSILCTKNIPIAYSDTRAEPQRVKAHP